MKKKVIGLLLCAVMVSGTLAGCTNKAKGESKSGSTDEKVTLSVWVPPLDDDTQGNWGPLLKAFEEENNCEINLELVPWDNYQEKYTTALNAEEGPDIGYMYAEMFPTFIGSGAVSDMREYLSDADYEEYIYLDRGEMLGGMYGFPIVTGVPFVLYYNEDILNELGEEPPKNWEDFERICKAATKDTDGDGKIDQYGYAAGMNSGDMSPLYILNSYYYSLLWQAGGDIYNEDLKSVRFHDEEGVKAVNFLMDLTAYMPENFMSLSGDDAFQTVFGAGKAAFGVTRSFQTQETTFKETYPELNWDYVTSLKDVNYGTFGAVDSLTLMSKCEYPELAVKLIKYIVSAEFMTEYHKMCPGAPMTVSEPYQGDAKMERIVTTDVDQYRALQVGPCGTEILQYLASDIQSVLSGDKETKEALDDAADYADQLLDEYWEDQE